MAIDTQNEFRAIQRYSAPSVGISPEPDGTFNASDEFAAFAGIYPIAGGFGGAAAAVGGSFFIHRPGDPVGKFTSQILPEPF